MLYQNKKTGKVGEFIEKNEKSRIVMFHVDGKPVAVSFSTFERWWKKLPDEETVPAVSSEKKGKGNMSKKVEKVTWEEIVKKFTEFNEAELAKYNENPENFEHKAPLKAVIVITADSFKNEYTEEQRSYYVDSDNYGFLPGSRKKTIAADSVDGEDMNVGLHLMLSKYGWKIDYGYYVK